MKGSYPIKVFNRRVQYKFTINRNLTILRGDSATGKTTLIDMIAAHQSNGESSGVTVQCARPCVVLTAMNWQLNLAQIQDSIVFIDEGDPFVATHEFAAAARASSNYYVIATRTSLFSLPYSITEVYGIKNNAGNRYQGTRRLYSSFYPLYTPATDLPTRPDTVIVEDSNAGFAFFSAVCKRYGIECISAGGKARMYQAILDCSPEKEILVIADGAAFGPEMERVLSLSHVRPLSIYLPESFEWLILQSGVIHSQKVPAILADPAQYVESSQYFSWERFFTDLLVTESRQMPYLHYQKSALDPGYLQDSVMDAILKRVNTDTRSFEK